MAGTLEVKRIQRTRVNGQTGCGLTGTRERKARCLDPVSYTHLR